MARAMNRLTALAVKRTAQPGRYPDGLGLYLFVGPTGNKSWVFRYRRQGRLHDLGLGPLHTVSLAEARAKALECRKMLLDGIDPIEARRSRYAPAKAAMTFEACAEAYIAAHRSAWRGTKSEIQWSASLRIYVYPIFGDLAVQAVDLPLIMQAIEPIWTAKPETASRVRQRIECVLDWAAVRGYRKGENPARWRGHLDKLLPKKTKIRAVVHHAALPYKEIAGFVAELQKRRAIAARALEFLILTASRTGEAIGARWDEIDCAERLWTIPGKRMKAGREHRVPLSQAALAVITAMREIRQNDFVFFGAKEGQSIQPTTLRALLHDMGRDDLTIHGLRSTFRDWAAERTSHPREVIEMALAHTVSGAVEAAYMRSDLFDKRRMLMDRWGSEVFALETMELEPYVNTAR
jgi:integrase